MKNEVYITWYGAVGRLILLGIVMAVLCWALSLVIFPTLDQIRDSGIRARQLEATNFQICPVCSGCVGIYVDPKTGRGTIYQPCDCK